MSTVKKQSRGLTRRSIFAAGAAVPLVGILRRPAFAAEFEYKLATGQDPTHPVNMRAQEALDRIREASGGRLDIKLFPANQLGSDTDMLSQVRSGGVEFFTLSGLILSTLVPAGLDQRRRLRVQGLRRGLEGDGRRASAPTSAAQIAKSRPAGVDKIWDNGFRQITSSTKPIKTPDDLKGFKIRVPVGAAVDVDVQGASTRRRPRSTSRGLLGAADQGGRRAGEPARHHRDGQAVRGAEVLLADQPHVGRLLVPRPTSAPGSGCRRTCRRSSRKHINAAA